MTEVEELGGEDADRKAEIVRVFTQAIGDRADDLASWLADFGRDYARLVREDHRRFVDAFRNGEIPGLPVH